MKLSPASIPPKSFPCDQPLEYCAHRQRYVSIAVFAVFIAAFVSAVVFIFTYGHPLPVEDEFVCTRFLTEGTFPDLIQLWGQHNEHRIPIARFLYHVISLSNGADSRFVMLASVVLLSGGAYFLMRAAAELRGYVAIWDALLPVLFLHPGHQDTLLNAFQICFALYAFWIGVLLYGMAVSQRSFRVSLPICGAALWGLILTCSAGVIVAAAGIPWLLLMFYSRWRNEAARKRSNEDLRIGFLVTFSVLVVLALYLYGLKTKKYPRNSDLFSVLDTAQIFIASSMGSVTLQFSALVSGVLVATFFAVGFRFIRGWTFEKANLALCGWILVGGGVLVLALVLGYTRGSLGGLPRYSILGAPLVAILLVISNLQIFKIARIGHALIVLIFLISFPFNVSKGLSFGRARLALYERVMADYRRGAGFHTIAEYYDSNGAIDPETIANFLERLQRQHLSAFTIEPDVPQAARTPRGQ